MADADNEVVSSGRDQAPDRRSVASWPKRRARARGVKNGLPKAAVAASGAGYRLVKRPGED